MLHDFYLLSAMQNRLCRQSSENPEIPDTIAGFKISGNASDHGLFSVEQIPGL